MNVETYVPVFMSTQNSRLLVYEWGEYKVYMQVLHQNILSTLLVREYEVYMQLFH